MQIALRISNWVAENANFIADCKLGYGKYKLDYVMKIGLRGMKLAYEMQIGLRKCKLDYAMQTELRKMQIGLRNAYRITENANWITDMQIGLWGNQIGLRATKMRT